MSKRYYRVVTYLLKVNLFCRSDENKDIIASWELLSLKLRYYFTNMTRIYQNCYIKLWFKIGHFKFSVAGRQPEDVRHKYISKWSQLVGIENFDMKKFLSSESEQLVWKSEGLPSDILSIENALIILKVCLSFFYFEL